MSADPTSSVNAWLDALPRARFFSGGRAAPAFRSCGVAGYYLALAVTLGGGLLAGRSLLVLAGLAAVSAASFFGWALARKRLTGREQLVLLEHVWLALGSCAGALWLAGLPLAEYLDPVAFGLCFFLAAGRAGCLVAGCCHGQPSSVGICYPEGHAGHGFAAHLVGVRLFPVQALEAAGLLAIGASGLAALALAPPGTALLWFLVAYSVMRFGLEGLRGDARPHLLGLSQSRWMALAELALALALGARAEPVPPRVSIGAAGLLAAALAAGLALRFRLDVGRRLRAPAHLAELRDAVAALLGASGEAPARRQTSQGLSIVASPIGLTRAHVSLALPGGRADLGLSCALAAAAFPELDPRLAQAGAEGVLHLVIRTPPGDARRPGLADELFGEVVRRAQQGAQPAAGEPTEPHRGPSPGSYFGEPSRGSYFGDAGGPDPRG